MDVLEERWSRRAERLDMMRFLYRNSTLERVRKCGRVAVGDVSIDVGTPVQGGPRVAGFRGLATCTSVWACPTCGPKIGRVRADEIRQALDAHARRGGHALFMTLTMHHHLGVSLSQLWNGLQAAWRSLRQRKTWKLLRKVGIHDLRVFEATVSEVTGWHPHFHIVLFVPDEGAEDLVLRNWTKLQREWSAAVEAQGRYADHKGQDLQVIDLHAGSTDEVDNTALADYVSKISSSWDIPSEVARGSEKRSRKGNRTPFQVLADLVSEEGDFDEDARSRDLAIWREWEKVTHDRRQVTWSRGLREELGVKESKVDDESVSQPDDVPNEVVKMHSIAGMLPSEWSKLNRNQQLSMKEELLRVAELSSADTISASLRAVCDSYGVQLLIGEDWLCHRLFQRRPYGDRYQYAVIRYAKSRRKAVVA